MNAQAIRPVPCRMTEQWRIAEAWRRRHPRSKCTEGTKAFARMEALVGGTRTSPARARWWEYPLVLGVACFGTRPQVQAEPLSNLEAHAMTRLPNHTRARRAPSPLIQ